MRGTARKKETMKNNRWPKRSREQIRDALLRARLRSEQPFLRVEKLDSEFAVYDVRREAANFYVMNGFATREEAEQYIAQFGDDNHVAEVKRRLDEERQSMARVITINKLLRGTLSDDEDAGIPW